jgi:hypothetical protein
MSAEQTIIQLKQQFETLKAAQKFITVSMANIEKTLDTFAKSAASPAMSEIARLNRLVKTLSAELEDAQWDDASEKCRRHNKPALSWQGATGTLFFCSPLNKFIFKQPDASLRG